MRTSGRTSEKGSGSGSGSDADIGMEVAYSTSTGNERSERDTDMREEEDTKKKGERVLHMYLSWRQRYVYAPLTEEDNYYGGPCLTSVCRPIPEEILHWLKVEAFRGEADAC